MVEMEHTVHSQGPSVLRDFRENGKLRREKYRENIFSECLVGGIGGKKSIEAWVFSPQMH